MVVAAPKPTMIVESPVREFNVEVPVVTDEVRRAWKRFADDLPQLLKESPDQWAAYSQHGRLSIGDNATDLYDFCFESGLRLSEFVVCQIQALSPLDDIR